MKSYSKALAIFTLVMFFLPLLAFSQKKSEKEETVKIPSEVKKVMNENLPTRQARLDIPLTYARTLYFPYQADYFSVFFLKIKNSDLGYMPPAGGELKKEEKAEEEEETILTCNLDFFFMIYSLDKNGQIKNVVKEIYLPYADQVGSRDYSPEEENFYSFGTIFSPGRYLLAAASTSLDLKKIGLVFQEFSLPEPSDYRKNLAFTPLFFVKSIKRMPSPDAVINIYKNLFHYATLEIEPKLTDQFSQNEKLDIFYFILGGTPAEDSMKYTFEIKYAYKKGEEEVVKFKPKVETIPAPIVSVPLDLTFTDKKLEPGEYTLEVSVRDQVGRKEGTSTIIFNVK